MKTFCGLISGLTAVLSILAALFGIGLYIVGYQVQDPKTAEFVRLGLEKTSLLDIVGGSSSLSNEYKARDEDEIIIPATRKGNHLYVEVQLNEFHNVKLMVDTGATDLLIKSELAYELNISEAESEKHTYNTANGSIQRFANKLDTVRIGDAVQHDV